MRRTHTKQKNATFNSYIALFAILASLCLIAICTGYAPIAGGIGVALAMIFIGGGINCLLHPIYAPQYRRRDAKRRAERQWLEQQKGGEYESEYERNNRYEE